MIITVQCNGNYSELILKNYHCTVFNYLQELAVAPLGVADKIDHLVTLDS